MSGTLYLIPTPLGPEIDPATASNADTVRALSRFIVEDVRTARRFLSALGTGRPIDEMTFAELNEHTSPGDIAGLVKPLLEGHDMGLMSEAGLPGIADPGAAVVALCHRNGISVKPLAGPSSIFLALMASGLNGQSFAFNGYLPVKPPERSKAIARFERRALSEHQSQLFIEAPYRNDKLLADMLATCAPETMITVAADLTQPTEYIVTRSVKEWRKTILPELHKRPAIFILGSAIG